MEHPFFPTTTTRAEALRWLTIAEKLLSARDLMGSKSFATRARDSDPTLTPADQILAVVDTLLAGDRRIGNNQQDLYAILRLTPQQGRESEAISVQYRNLAIALNPQKNKFPFAEQAFRLVVDAWSVLSNPTRKSLYDKEISFYSQPPPQQQQQPDPFSNPLPAMHQNFIFFGGSSSSGLTPQPQSSGVPFSQAQVHASPQADPVGGGSTREPQNFMSFTSGTNLVFGGASGSKVSSEPVNKHAQEGFPTFAANATAAPAEQNYSVVGEKTSHDVNVSENVGEKIEEEEEEEEEEEDVEGIGEQEERVGAAGNDGGLTFWTACPYCYYMYEYPKLYADCTMRCQNCKKAFQAVVIPSPPPVVDGQEGYFCCWGFLPMGFSMENWEKNKDAASTWTPFSPMFTCPQAGDGKNNTRKAPPPRKSTEPRIYVDEDEAFVEVSESSGSDDDWNKDAEKRKKKARNVKGKGASGTSNRSVRKAQVDKGKNVTVQDGSVPPNGVETPNKTAGDSTKKGAAANARKQPARVAKNFEKLDLNVEFSNEAEEPATRVNQGNGPSRGEDDNIEGIGFFEGLDEFLSSLPILNVVGDDKVVKAA
ncbi:hypothetical protein C2S52_018008 [Perilla frutescens var. hirtella]|uniref:J domain-containing protein n=1 Tax=Perilla frutescens var. hirtella TaxID=608512 RepID=A0AAD4IY77_PERFH|nr:hypothetical protein C2S52_018008 [Perilla frutescens var. hirtella]KAH6811757.1 hypothetical protein C2S51_025519 [Perilla frutescens var. frutescens]KAH6823612.1 hypothetical protein C2S53_006519 [Perilla frutescens var. hirtella]